MNGEANDQSDQNTNDEEEQELLAARLPAGKVVKLAGQRDVDSLYDSAASLLNLGEREQHGGDTVADDESAPPPAAAAAAVKAAAEPPAMLSDADMMMVGSFLRFRRWC